MALLYYQHICHLGIEKKVLFSLHDSLGLRCKLSNHSKEKTIQEDRFPRPQSVVALSTITSSSMYYIHYYLSTPFMRNSVQFIVCVFGTKTQIEPIQKGTFVYESNNVFL